MEKVHGLNNCAKSKINDESNAKCYDEGQCLYFRVLREIYYGIHTQYIYKYKQLYMYGTLHELY